MNILKRGALSSGWPLRLLGLSHRPSAQPARIDLCRVSMMHTPVTPLPENDGVGGVPRKSQVSITIINQPTQACQVTQVYLLLCQSRDQRETYCTSTCTLG